MFLVCLIHFTDAIMSDHKTVLRSGSALGHRPPTPGIFSRTLWEPRIHLKIFFNAHSFSPYDLNWFLTSESAESHLTHFAYLLWLVMVINHFASSSHILQHLNIMLMDYNNQKQTRKSIEQAGTNYKVVFEPWGSSHFGGRNHLHLPPLWLLLWNQWFSTNTHYCSLVWGHKRKFCPSVSHAWTSHLITNSISGRDPAIALATCFCLQGGWVMPLHWCFVHTLIHVQMFTIIIDQQHSVKLSPGGNGHSLFISTLPTPNPASLVFIPGRKVMEVRVT